MSKLQKELFRFVVAGVSAVATDLLTYILLLNFLAVDISKGISFLLGTALSYLVNKFWTFEQKTKSFSEVLKFGVLYGLTLCINIYANKLVIDYTDMVLLAFLCATGLSTVLNFIGQKWWVFKK